MKKENIKLFLYIIFTISIIVAMIVIAIITREKPILAREYTDTHTQRELLDIIDHSHTVN